ncbi:MAG: HAD-IB family phosphatase [Verrucomicrobiales bacterium]|nr:HAD-IB family phosphatase [Verrucomicrobiales bacterium]
MSNETTKYAFFDLDHTILPQDTQVLFAQYVMVREPWRRVFLLWFLPCLIPAALKIFDLRMMKRIFSSYLWGMPQEKLLKYASDFVDEVVPKISYPEIVAEVDRLKSEGYCMILNSASPEFYVEKISAHFGFDHFIGTQMVLSDPMPWLPPIVGPNNKRGAKITAMKERGLIPRDYDPAGGPFPDSWAFSDSSADIPLLSIAEHAVTIHPGSVLAERAAEKGWDTRLPPRPYEGKWGSKIATFRLALGLGRKFLG